MHEKYHGREVVIYQPALVTYRGIRRRSTRLLLAGSPPASIPATAKVEKPIKVEVVITKDEENFLAQGWAIDHA